MNETRLAPAINWFKQQGWKPLPFQLETWHSYLKQNHGLLNAPTGSGKTYAMFWGVLLELLERKEKGESLNGLQAIWITPIRALAIEIQQSIQRIFDDLALEFTVGIRNGDTPTAERTKQTKNPPTVLITTPESLHLLFAQKNYKKRFSTVKAFVVDEWHELIGSKRGVQIELAGSRLKTISPNVRIWGISATIGNMDESVQVLLGITIQPKEYVVVRADIQKKIEIKTILPDEIDKFPWGGHLGIGLADQIIGLIEKSETTLVFTNTRSQTEIWYQRILEKAPRLAGLIAMHHGSISKEIRNWVETAIHGKKLKAVVCTSSLDLGVDFRPVETIIQIGGPKGVSRFTQRAGRSGHQPNATSVIYFAPTNSLELLEASAIREAVLHQEHEERRPYIRSFDVLIQYLVTLAVSDGFRPDEILQEIKTTYSYSSISDDEWFWLLNFIVNGGDSLDQYDEYKRVEVIDGVYKVTSRRVAMRHRLSIGTIVSDQMLQIKYVKGSYLGTVEEWFISRFQPGDVFWFAGRPLEFSKMKDNTVYVRRAKSQKASIPSWQGGRMPLSSKLGAALRHELTKVIEGELEAPELQKIQPLIEKQKERSHVPIETELLIEEFKSREGYHVFIYPFEGRFVHEGLSSLFAWRIGQIKPISFSISFNDYGFELLSDQEIPLQQALQNGLLSPKYSMDNLLNSVNSTALADRRFRDIAKISGMLFSGYPGKPIRDKHLQASSHLIFEVLKEHEPENLLLRQAYEEVLDFQLEEVRLRRALNRMNQQTLILKQLQKPSPFCFPIMVERFRERFTNETLADRVKKMQVQFE